LAKVVKNYCDQDCLGECLAGLFKMIATSVVLRNGDAHRKNFCLIYDNPEERRGKLAPTFDIVTTTVYLPYDAMALTLDGSKKWPGRKRLLNFATAHCDLQPKQAAMILQEVRQGTRQAQKELKHGIAHLKGFAEVGRAMCCEWEKGLREI
jgi:serine/threonine-protein kinase HipA